MTPAASGECSPNKVKFRTSNVSVNMTSTTFAVVPNTALSFTQSSPDCVIVRYSAMAAATYPRWIPLRVVLDGSVIAEPGDIQYEGYTEISTARSFDFVFPAVAAGAHTVRVEWRSFNGGIIFMHDRTITLHYR